ncbi:MAG: molybdopterin-guanine dinucleotide biosynthesis protein B [Cellvibrionaceae bacterium]
MKVFGITGWKNSGKTTLVTSVVKSLSHRGFSVATIKHAHHAFDIDHPGKDSYLHRQAGAQQVLVASKMRWALMHELSENDSSNPEPTLDELLLKLTPVDIVIVEGFKRCDHPKLAVIRPDHNPEPLPDESPLVAIASDKKIDPLTYGCSGPLFSLKEIDNIVDFIVEYCSL